MAASGAGAPAAASSRRRPSGGDLAAAVEDWADAVTLPADEAGIVRSAVFALKNALEGLPIAKVTNASSTVPGLPLLQRTFQTAELEFHPPSAVDVVGSYMLGTVCAASDAAAVDVMLTMPAACAGDAHRKNFHLHDLSRLYLRHCADALVASGAYASVEVGMTGGDPTALHLVLRPAAFLEGEAPQWLQRLVLHLHAVPDVAALQVHLLHPKWNNVVRWLHRKAAPQPPTPAYNSSLLMGASAKASLAALHTTFAAVPVAARAAVLLKDWLTARGLAGRVGGWSGAALTALVGVLAQRGVVKPSMNTAQAMRAVLLHVARSTWAPMRLSGSWSGDGDSSEGSDSDSGTDSESEQEDEGYASDGSDSSEDSDGSGGSDGSGHSGVSEEGGVVPDDGAGALAADGPAPSDAEWAEHFPVVIVCPTQWVNLAAAVSPAAAVELQRHAALSLPAFGAGSDASARRVLVDDPSALAAMAGSSKDRMAGAIAAPAAAMARGRAKEALAALRRGTPPLHQAYDRVLPLPLPDAPVAFPLGGTGSRPAKRARSDGNKAAFMAGVAAAEAAGVSAAQGAALVAGPWWLGLQRRAEAVLTAGLGDRVHCVAVLPVWRPRHVSVGEATPAALAAAGKRRSGERSPLALPAAWALGEAAPQPTSLVVALTVCPRSASRMVDRGPPEAVDAAGAAAFAQLWGPAAAPRRFADGAIVPAMVWQRPTAARSGIVDGIVAHLAERHCWVPQPPLPQPSPAEVLEAASQPPTAGAAEVPKSAPWRASAAASASSVDMAADVLLRALQRTPGLPLRVLGLQTAAWSARSTAWPSLAPHPAAADSEGAAATEADGTVPRTARAVDCVVTLEASGKWPRDLAAIAAAKTALLLKIKYGLPKVLHASVAVSMQVPPALRALFADVAPGTAALIGESRDSLAEALGVQAGSSLLDDDLATWAPAAIVMHAGYVFRLWLWLPAELAGWTALTKLPASAALGSTELTAPYGGLFASEASIAAGLVVMGRLGGASAETPVAPAPARPATDMAHLRPTARTFVSPPPLAAQRRAQALYRQCVLAPRHAKAVATFARVYPAFAGAARLAARWLAAQGALHAHVSAEAVELTVAHVVMTPAPCGVPASSAAAFRAWLAWLARWDFASSPLLVDWEGDATRADVGAVTSAALTARVSAPASVPAWYIVTPWERGAWRPQWTGTGTGGQPGPAPIVAARLRAAAGSALATLAAAQCLASGLFLPAPQGGAARKRGREEEAVALDSAAALLAPMTPLSSGDFDVTATLHSSAAVAADGMPSAALRVVAFKNTLPALRRRLLLDWSPATALAAAVHRGPLASLLFAFPSPDGRHVYLALRPDGFPTPPRPAVRKALRGTAKPAAAGTAAAVHAALQQLRRDAGDVLKTLTLHC